MDRSSPDLLQLCRESLIGAEAAEGVDQQLRSLQAALRLARAACAAALDQAAGTGAGRSRPDRP